MDDDEGIMPDYEELSKQQLQRISYLANHAPDAAFLMDAYGHFLYVNEESGHSGSIVVKKQTINLQQFCVTKLMN